MESDRVQNTPQDGASDGLPRRPPHGRPTGPTRRSTKGQWTADEDDILCQAVHRYKGKNWKKIAECFKDRTDVQCLHRWQKVLNPELVKGPWTKEEDGTIIELVDKFGAKKWSTIAQHLPGRIGKQCRERWHNHLNPAINKEAWTQEEELALIRAHQIYGNKWAELTKFLPGRSDNSIKNHWNSSVKKKLGSYISSGLLGEFPVLPHVGQHNPLIPSSSSNTQQSIGNDFGPMNGTVSEDISECSQGSTVFGCSQDTSDMANTVLHTGNDSSQGNPVSSSQQYYTLLEEGNYYVPEIPFEVGCSYFEQDFSHETGTSANQGGQFNLPEFRDISSVERSQGVQATNMEHEPMHATLQAPLGIESSTMLEHMVTGSNQLDDTMRSEDDCCRVIIPEDATHGCTSSRSFQVCEAAESSAPQAYNPVRSDINLPLLCSDDQYRAIYGNVPVHLQDLPIGTQDHEFLTGTHEDFIFTNDSGSYPYDNDVDNNIDLQEQSNQISPSEYLVPTDNTLVSSTPSDVNTEEQSMGSLCYEPPRFPSLDFPFLSCDLAQSGSDMQQEFSPLGIRQLMLNCLSPFRSWESPSRDGNSPVALLKSAAKTFTNTPSIMKKRNRDLLSPLSERRSDKKIGRDFAQRTLSGLARNFSNIDEMFDEQATSPSSVHKKSLGVSIEDKENLDESFKGGNVEGKENSDDMKGKGIAGSLLNNQIADEETYEDSDGVLAEHNLNSLFSYSPDSSEFKANRAQGNSTGNPFASGKKLHEHTVKAGSIRSPPSSTPLRISVDNARYGAGIDNATLSGETHFKRCMQSPSAWISPRFLNSFLPGPRVDTEISIEDIEYLLTPGSGSYDAIGLMKQLSEHSASTFANAKEVLGNETLERFLRERQSSSPSQNRCHLASNILTERRMLDFNECVTPRKSKENELLSVGTGSTSPSSYLLKSCR